MNIKVLITGLIISFLFIVCCFSQQDNKIEILKQKERQILKEVGFFKCIKYCLPKGDSIISKDGSIGEYFLGTAYDHSAYIIIDSVSKKYASKDYSNADGFPLNFFKCFKFYNNKELDSLIFDLDKYFDDDILRIKMETEE